MTKKDQRKPRTRKPRRKGPRAQRLDAVEVAIRSGEWCYDRAVEIADEYGVKVRQVYRDRETVADRFKADCPAERETRRRLWLADVRRNAERMEREGANGPLVALLRLEQRTLGLDDVPPPEPITDDDEVIDMTDELAVAMKHARDLKRRLDLADARGSMVAAVQLSKLHAEALERIATIERDRRDAAERAADEDGILEDLESELRNMPPELLDRMAEAIERARTNG